jgi:hypothetical protein
MNNNSNYNGLLFVNQFERINWLQTFWKLPAILQSYSIILSKFTEMLNKKKE